MSYGRSRTVEIQVPITVVSTVIVALIAGAALGGVLHALGLAGAVAALYGVDGLVDDWIVILVHSLIGSAVFVAVLERVARSRYAPLPVAEAIRRPFLGACVGAAYGVVLWLIVVAVGVPLLADVVAGGHLPFPYRHGPSLLALGWFGTVLGAWYPLLYETFDPTE